MALSTVTITYDIADLVGVDFDARRTKVYVTTNTDSVIDTEGNQIRVGDGLGTIAADGTGSVSVWAPGTGSNPATWQTNVHIDYAPRSPGAKRETLTYGPFTITASGDLADLVQEQIAIPTATAADYANDAQTSADDSAASAAAAASSEADAQDAATASLTSATAAQAAQTEAEAARTGAEAAQEAAEALVISDLGTTDGQTRALIEAPASQTAGALSDLFGQRPTRNPVTGEFYPDPAAATTDLAAALQAALSAAAAAGTGNTVRYTGGVVASLSSMVTVPADTQLVMVNVRLDQSANVHMFTVGSRAQITWQGVNTIEGNGDTRGSGAGTWNVFRMIGATDAAVTGSLRITNWRGIQCYREDTERSLIEGLSAFDCWQGFLRGRAVATHTRDNTVRNCWAGKGAAATRTDPRTNFQADGEWAPGGVGGINTGNRANWRTSTKTVINEKWIACHSDSTTFAGFFINSGRGCQISECDARDATDYALGLEFCIGSRIDNCTGSTAHTGAMLFQNNEDCSVNGGTYYSNVNDGVSFTYTNAQATAGDTPGRGCSFNGVTAYSNGRYGANINTCTNASVVGGNYRANVSHGVWVNSAVGVTVKTNADQNGGDGVRVRHTQGFTLDVNASENTLSGICFESGNTPAETRYGTVRGLLRSNIVSPVSTSGFNTTEVDITARCDGTLGAAVLSLVGNNGTTALRTHTRGTGSPAGVVLGAAGSTYTQVDGTTPGGLMWTKRGAGTTTTGWELAAAPLKGTGTLDFPSIAAGGTQTRSLTVTGAALGDAVALAPPTALEAGLVGNGHVSAANTVSIKLSNITAAAIDPASATWGATVSRVS